MAAQFPIPGQQPLNAPKLTLAMLRESKLLTCDCGGTLFEEGMFFKKISPLISPSGKEEYYPMGVVICRKCGKVPSKLNKEDLIPPELLAQSDENIKLV